MNNTQLITIIIGIIFFTFGSNAITAKTSYRLGQDRGKLSFFEELYTQKIECKITADSFIMDKIE